MGMVMGLLFMARMIMIMRAVFAGMHMVMIVFSAFVRVWMAVNVYMSMAVGMLMRMAVDDTVVFMWVFMNMGVLMFMLVLVPMIAFHFWPPFYHKVLSLQNFPLTVKIAVKGGAA